MAEILILLLLYGIVSLFSRGNQKKSNSGYRNKNKNSEDDDLFFTDLGNGMGF